MAKNILKKTNRKVGVKVSGAGVTETITLATDCAVTGETVSSPTVSILSVTWTGAPDATATITRGTSTDPILVLQGNTAGEILFADAEFNENIDSAQNIKVVTVGHMQVYFLLRKETGYTIADPNSFTF
jgi:hypothetical protein